MIAQQVSGILPLLIADQNVDRGDTILEAIGGNIFLENPVRLRSRFNAKDTTSLTHMLCQGNRKGPDVCAHIQDHIAFTREGANHSQLAALVAAVFPQLLVDEIYLASSEHLVRGLYLNQLLLRFVLFFH